MISHYFAGQSPVSVAAEDKKFPAVPLQVAVLPQLSDEQQAVRKRILNGESLYVRGIAGTGKSFALKIIKESAEAMSMNVGTTALTGIAGTHVNGVTIHSYLGIGDGTDSVEVIVSKLKKGNFKKEALQNCKNTKLLIVDEISMMSAELWEKIDRVLRKIRECPSKPFGGMAVLAMGDFAQLPPVFRKLPPTPNGVVAGKLDQRLVFESPIWREMFPPKNCMRFTKIFRQKDEELVKMLADLRNGRVSPASWTTIKKCARDLPAIQGIEPTVLFATKVDVDAQNQSKLNALPGELRVFNAKDNVFSGAKDAYTSDKLDGLFQARRKVELKVDAQVMLILNLDCRSGLVNGARGRVLSLNQDGTITVVFLSGKVCKFKPECFEIKDCHRNVIAQRVQLPFILAWACTIHKSQGMSLDYVTMDLTRCFEKGQVYVACSRAKTLEGLQIKGLQENLVRTDQRVREYEAEARAAEAEELEEDEEEEEEEEVKEVKKPIAAASSSSSSSSAASAHSAKHDWEASSESEDEEEEEEEESSKHKPAPGKLSSATPTDTEVLAWYAKQNNSTLESVRWLAKKRMRK